MDSSCKAVVQEAFCAVQGARAAKLRSKVQMVMGLLPRNSIVPRHWQMLSLEHLEESLLP